MRSIRFLFALTFALAPISLCADSPSGLALMPATISLKGPSGASYTRAIVIRNLTTMPLAFHVEAEDVVIESGERKFVPAGQTNDSAAQRVTVPHDVFMLQPGEEYSAQVSFVLPSASGTRGVVVFFVSEPLPGDPRTKVRVRLGTVVDFTISDAILLNAEEPVVTPPSASSNAVVTERLLNIGSEPVTVKGTVAFLDTFGKLVGKANFDQKRLFPGEQNTVRAEYAGELAKGKYRVLCTLAFAGKTMTKTVEIVVE